MGTGYERNHNSNDLTIFLGRLLPLRRGEMGILGVSTSLFGGGLGIFIFIKFGEI
jgi:hypothetical protein